MESEEGMLENVKKSVVAKLEASSPDREMRIEMALNSLIGLYSDHRFREMIKSDGWGFKDKFNVLLFREGNARGLNVYMGDCARYAEQGRLTGFEEACWRRSVLQILDDHFINWEYSGARAFENNFRENIDDIDETLKEVSDNAPPVPEPDIPDYEEEEGHWWWRSPVRQDMSEAERVSRLEYDFYDGVDD